MLPDGNAEVAASALGSVRGREVKSFSGVVLASKGADVEGGVDESICPDAVGIGTGVAIAEDDGSSSRDSVTASDMVVAACVCVA